METSAKRTIARRAVLAGAGVIALLSGVDGADVMADAHADEPQCVADAPQLCPQQVDQQQADLPKTAPPRKNHIRVYCHPAGPMAGAHCMQQWVP